MFLECLESGDKKTISAYNTFKKWVLFEGKKLYAKQIAKIEKELKEEDESLYITKQLAEVWVDTSLTDRRLTFLEEAISLSLKLEWPDSSMNVDYIHKRLKFLNNKTGYVFEIHNGGTNEFQS